MKKTLLIGILVVATGWLGGCSVSYEEYRSHRHPRRVVIAPPPIEVVEVIRVPRHYRRPPRPPWPPRPHPWR